MVNVDPSGQTCITVTRSGGDQFQADNGDGLGCSDAGVNPSRNGQFDPTRDIQPQQIDVNAQQGSLLNYLSAITFNQIPDQEIDNTVVPPTNQEYVDAIQHRLAQLPNVCDAGITVRAGFGRSKYSEGSNASLGFDLNTQKGLRPAGVLRVGNIGSVQGSFSMKGSSVSPSVNIRIPDTPLSVGVGFDGFSAKIKSINAGVRLGPLTAQVYGGIGTVGDSVNSQCR